MGQKNGISIALVNELRFADKMFYKKILQMSSLDFLILKEFIK